MVDPAWHSFGASSEIITSIIEKNFKNIKSKPVRITLPDSHTPMSKNLEKDYYFGDKKIVSKILEIVKT